MNYATPEELGIYSENILRFLEKLEDSNLASHSMILMRSGKIFFEKYWEPFRKNDLHRMYSVTKSFVSLAIGCLAEEGLIDLDDEISKYFSEELKSQKDLNVHKQTIRHMLMMCTAKRDRNWFVDKPDDRVRYYFENNNITSRLSGTIFEYDTGASFVLGALVERVSGMPLLDYLRKKCLDKIGFSKEAYCLKCPGGHSWSDSGLLCTARDLLVTAQLVMNGGQWAGEQLLNRQYIQEAISKRVDNNPLNLNEYNMQGYGYYFWRTFDNSYFFNGMGGQLAVCVPDKEIIFIYNSDNQGNEYARKIIIDNFFELIVRNAKKIEVHRNAEEREKLLAYSENLKLFHLKGRKSTDLIDHINNKEYIMNENEMGITKICMKFEDDIVELHYWNEQGYKKLVFGICRNEFTVFPQDGYADQIGTVKSNIHYRCANSAAWISTTMLAMKVQIIDKYLGNLNIQMAFKGDEIAICMNKTAEDFMEEYQGFASGYMSKDNKRQEKLQ